MYFCTLEALGGRGAADKQFLRNLFGSFKDVISQAEGLPNEPQVRECPPQLPVSRARVSRPSSSCCGLVQHLQPAA